MAYIDFWRRWKDFSGRTGRSDYWLAILTHIFYSFVLMISASIFFVAVLHLTVEEAIRVFEIFWSIYGIIWIVPFLSMTVRRFRDAGYNRKNFWKLLVPWHGLIALFTQLDETKDDESKES